MFHFGDDYLYPTKCTLHDLPRLASPKGEMASSFSWTSLFKSPTSSTLCFGDSTLTKLNQVKLLCETEFCITKYTPLYDPVVHTGTTFLLTSKTLPHKPKTYLQDKPSTTPSEVQSEETEEATPIHLTKVYKSLSHGTEHINWQRDAMLLTQVPCPITSTFYPGSKLLALLDHTFVEAHLMHMERHYCVDLTKSLWITDKPSMFGTPSSLLLQTLLSLFQDLLPTHTKFPTDTPT